MADKVVDIPGVGVVAFPDSMSDDAIASSAARLISEHQGPSFVPKTGGEFLSRMKDAAIDIPIGAAKNLGRAVQMVPGFAAGTDRIFGLPEGASEKAMQPTNATQTAGGYVGDAALIAATGGAEIGAPVIRAGQVFGRPTVADIAINDVAKPAAEFGGETVKAITAKLTSGGPVTADKVADLIVKYGKDAVKLGIVGVGGAGGYELWRAVRHLF